MVLRKAGCIDLGCLGQIATKQWGAPWHWSKSPVYSHLELGGQSAAISPTCSIIIVYPDPRLASLKGNAVFFVVVFLVAVILNTHICLPFPQYVLCWKFRVFWQLLNVFWVLCSLEIEIICLFSFLQTCFYTSFCCCWGGDGYALHGAVF